MKEIENPQQRTQKGNNNKSESTILKLKSENNSKNQQILILKQQLESLKLKVEFSSKYFRFQLLQKPWSNIFQKH